MSAGKKEIRSSEFFADRVCVCAARYVESLRLSGSKAFLPGLGLLVTLQMGIAPND
jgi:hypothetical protein